MLVAVLINVDAIHILQNKIGLAIRGQTRIKQLGDVGVSQAAEDASFAFEAFLPTASRKGQIYEFDRRLTLEPAIAAFRQPDTTHSPLSNWRDKAVQADCASCKSGLSSRPNRSIFEETLVYHSTVLSEKDPNLIGQAGILFPKCG